MKKYIVDVQGFKITLNEFVFKEVAIVPLEEDPVPSVFLFKPPYAWDKLLDKNKSENRWLEENFHGIMWRTGTIPYEQVKNTLRGVLDGAEIYVKGLEKVKWLTTFFPDELVFNIEEMGCPSLRKLTIDPLVCRNHNLSGYPVCAFRNAMALKTWMLDNQERIKLLHDLPDLIHSMFT